MKSSVKSVNKSELIRNYIKENPTATPKEVASALSKSGTYVSNTLVSNVLSNARKKDSKAKKPGSRPASTAATLIPGHDPLVLVRAAREFVGTCGSIYAAKQVIDEIVDCVESINAVGK